MGICSSCLGGRRSSESNVRYVRRETRYGDDSHLPYSNPIRHTSSMTRTHPTTAPPAAHTMFPRPIQKNCAAREKRSSAFALRRLSTYTPNTNTNTPFQPTLVRCLLTLPLTSNQTINPRLATRRPPSRDQRTIHQRHRVRAHVQRALCDDT